MHIKVVSRASALAVVQAEMVAAALTAAHPNLDVELIARSATGDRDQRLDLWSAEGRGVFTMDLSEMVARGDADIAVHSWKDLPLASAPGTTVAGTLERADARDVLLLRADVVSRRPATLSVLSSSPRRRWQIETSLPPLLPWPVAALQMTSVRGNIPTRLRKLLDAEGDALVVAKAALDRLLELGAPESRRDVRSAIDSCRWMVLPLREFPTAPAQGALAIEINSSRNDLYDLVQAISHQPTMVAVARERAILASFGGGCHEAVGASVLVRDYGLVISVNARVSDRAPETTWSLEPNVPAPTKASPSAIWPRKDERDLVSRRALDAGVRPRGDLFITRAEALPTTWQPSTDQIVWAAGTRTWQRLAQRGVWVHGCSDGLGDAEPVLIETLKGSSVRWHRLTHAASTAPGAIPTYVVEQALPSDLPNRTHFYWSSGSQFLEAIARFPSIHAGEHASGPGRTARAIRDTLASPKPPTIWLDYEQWHHAVTS